MAAAMHVVYLFICRDFGLHSIVGHCTEYSARRDNMPATYNVLAAQNARTSRTLLLLLLLLPASTPLIYVNIYIFGYEAADVTMAATFYPKNH